MAVKNNRRTIITKKILKDYLLELMQTKPTSKITIKEICDLSNMSNLHCLRTLKKRFPKNNARLP